MPRPSLPRLRRPAPATWLAFGAGFLIALSLPPWGFWPLAIVGIVLFETALGEAPTRREAAARGWWFGAAWMFPGMGWMWFLTAPGYLVAGALFAGLHALAAALAPTGPWRVVGRPAAHALVEAVRLAVPFGGVPLATLAIGQASGPLVGIARVGGVILLSWAVLQIGFALAGPSPFVPATVRRTRGGAVRGEWHGVIGLAAVLVVLVVAAVAPSGSDEGPALRVAAVQGGGPQGTRAIDTDPRDVVERHLEATATIEPGSVDVVVWPENVIDVATFTESVEFTEITAEARRIGVPLVVGITEDARDVDGFLNAQVVVTPEGELVARYDKVRRVPFGEYVPLRGLLEALGAPVDQIRRDAVAGTGPAVLDLPDGTRFGVAISWEIFFGGRVRDGVGRDADVVVNPTNGSSYTGTILQSQQVASSRLRAVESGRWVVQVSPTGFSAFVSPDGDVFDRTSVSERVVLVRAVPLRSGTTWYTSAGDVPWTVALVVILAASWLVPAARRRSASGRAPEVTLAAGADEPVPRRGR